MPKHLMTEVPVIDAWAVSPVERDILDVISELDSMAFGRIPKSQLNVASALVRISLLQEVFIDDTDLDKAAAHTANGNPGWATWRLAQLLDTYCDEHIARQGDDMPEPTYAS